MKRDLDLLRSILIALENHPHAEMRSAPNLPGVGEGLTAEHIIYLREAGYVTATAIRGLDSETTHFALVRITMAGHDFLESIRDPDIWRQTKKGAADVGSWTITLVAELAKGYIKAKAHALGLPI